jgi:hypothetical protein
LDDAETLTRAGCDVGWLWQSPAIYAAEIARHETRTRLEWVVDSDFRFFPTIADETFGYVLHPIDLATNKVMAVAGRRNLRDLVDLLLINDTILSLGPVIWAAVGKAPGFTPEGLIARIRRNSNHPATEWRALITSEPLDPHLVLARLRAALDEAEAFVTRMPTDKVGLLFLKDGEVVQPDPDRLAEYQTHAGQRRGHWPSSSEITSAMLEHYRNPPRYR